MSTMRAYTREFRESAVSRVLSEGLSIRKAADDLGMPYHTLHGWVRAARRSRRKPVQKVQPRTTADAEARERELEAEVRKLMLERDMPPKLLIATTCLVMNAGALTPSVCRRRPLSRRIGKRSDKLAVKFAAFVQFAIIHLCLRKHLSDGVQLVSSDEPIKRWHPDLEGRGV
jgi:transposase-like protein